MLAKEVTEYLRAHRDEQLEQLFELLRFPSISSQSPREGDCLACVEQIAEHLRGLGFSTDSGSAAQRPETDISSASTLVSRSDILFMVSSCLI